MTVQGEHFTMESATTIVKCKLCSGRGKDYYDKPCEGCGGPGSVAVIGPATDCALCYGRGKDYYDKLCVGCDGCGYALRITGTAASSSFASHGGTAEIIAELQAIRNASNQTAQQIAEFGSVAYFVGLFVSMGMNFALGNGLGSLLVCLLSWLNVGYIAVGLATGTYATHAS